MPKKVFPGSFNPTLDKEFVPASGSIFVFGSNLAGMHGGGAAATAAKLYGARMTQGEGLQGQIYKTVEGPITLPNGKKVLSKWQELTGWRGENGCGSYALPTKGFDIETLPLHVIEYFVGRLYDCTLDNLQLNFFVTRVGCGLGGYTDDEIAPLFRRLEWDSNVILPEGWS